MNGRTIAAAWGVVWISAAVWAQNTEDTRLLSQPALSDQHLAFVYDGDLWLAERDGSQPRRLTSHEGSESSPRFSPDGQWLAFTAEYDGNSDVYLMSIRGGTPLRLTYHPAADNVECFSPDGALVIFSSGRDTYTNRYQRLFAVSVKGGFPLPLPVPHGLRASVSPDGRKIAYIPIGERFNQWKHYRGGTTSRIWIQDLQTLAVQQVPQPEGRCNDTDPQFIGDQLYFRSDREGEFNVFHFDPATETVAGLTAFTDFPIARLGASRDALIFEQAGYLHLLDPATRQAQRLKIGVTSDFTDVRPRWVSGSKWIRGAELSRSGARAAFEFRGEIVTVPAEKGDPRNLTRTPGVHERSPAWSPDGKSIAYFSDEGGEYQLHIAPHDGKGEVQTHAVQGHGFYESPRWSPDGTKIAYLDNSTSLYVYDLAARASALVASSPVYGPSGAEAIPFSWSHDSRWLAYTVSTHALIQQLFVYSVAEQTSHPITDGLSDVSDPTFDPSGKYLYVAASTDAGPVRHWFAMSNADTELSQSIYLVVLRDDGENPLAKKNDEEKPEAAADAAPPSGEGDKAPSAADGQAQDAAAKPDAAKADGTPAAEKPEDVRIDFPGIDQRIVALPLESAVYTNLRAPTAGTLLFVRQNREGKKQLVSYALESREATDMLDGVDAFRLSGDGKKVLYSVGESWGIAASAGKVDASKGKLALDAIQVLIDPRQEWRQMFEEAWRINRDYFYDPQMHGCDWPAMREKYRPLIEDCVTRGDVNRVIMWLCSELAVGHHYLGGGDQRQTADKVPGGLLGADFELADGRYRVKKVYGGLNWNGELRSPLTEPGVRVAAGQYLFSVNGADLHAEDNLYRHLQNAAGKIVELTVGSKPDGSDARTVRVVPLESENELRNRDWVEGNLRRVQEATAGRVAYVYVPDTSTGGHTSFKRYFFPQTDRQAIILDERFNGGGQVADYYIDHLRREYLCHWATRYGQDFDTPSGAIFGPKVLLIDETAGSGGDLLPWMFRKLKIGPLVGKRTWGGLVGILGFPVLMDGGQVTAPNLAFWTENGFGVENEGVPPDVEVEQWPAEVLAGRDPQLEKAIEIVLKELEANPPKEYRKPPYPVRVRR